jgi:hypothetical protein
MANLKLEIDSDHLHDKTTHPLASAAEKVGLLSSIPLSPELIAAFAAGVGQTIEPSDQEMAVGYKRNNIKAKKNVLKGRGIKVVATVGGLVVFKALNDETGATMPPYVSLVGRVPTGDLGNCRGGVSLESYRLNRARKDYLKALPGGVHTDATIFLLTNNNSAMNPEQKAEWASDPTFLESYVGDGAGNNDATKFAWDFFGQGQNPPKVPNTATAIIVSDDPFFQASRLELITQANLWLAQSAQRQIVYPSKMYEMEALPAPNQSTLIGPDLARAYQLLGILAYRLVTDKSMNFGFFTLASETTPIK